MPTPIREQLLAAITTAVGGEYGIPAPEDERDLPVTIVQDDVARAADQGKAPRAPVAVSHRPGRRFV